MKKTVWTFGLITGAILSAMMLITTPFWRQIGYDRAEVIGYTTMVVAFLMVFVGVKSYRDNVRGGTISFGRAAAVGGLIVLIASVCYTATWQLIYHQLMPGVRESLHEMAIERARDQGGTPEAIAARVAEAERFSAIYRNPLVNSAITFLEPLPVGVVMMLVTAGILSRKRRADASQNLPSFHPEHT